MACLSFLRGVFVLDIFDYSGLLKLLFKLNNELGLVLDCLAQLIDGLGVFGLKLGDLLVHLVLGFVRLLELLY